MDSRDLKDSVEKLNLTQLRSVLLALNLNQAGRTATLKSRVLRHLDDPKQKELCFNAISRIINPIGASITNRAADSTTTTPYSLSYRGWNATRRKNSGSDSESSQSPEEVYTSATSRFPIHPDVKFKDLPFYEKLGELIKPTTLHCSVANRLRGLESNLVFHLTPAQAQLMKAGRRPGPEYTVQVLMRIGLLETTSEQNDCHPPGLNVSVNNILLPIASPNPNSTSSTDHSRMQQPLNITPFIRIDATVGNRIFVTTQPHFQKYVAAVYLVNKRASHNLLHQLKVKGVKVAYYTRAMIIQKLKDDENEIAPTYLRVKLVCPLGKMRLQIPGRAVTCDHVQCFDCSTYLLMNEKKPTWLCPICNKPALFEHLVIDEYFQKVLSSERLPDDCTEVQLTGDGHWTPVLTNSSAGCSNLRKVNKKSVSDVEVLTSSDSESGCAVLKKSAGATEPPVASAKSALDVVDLVSEDELDDSQLPALSLQKRWPVAATSKAPSPTLICLSGSDASSYTSSPASSDSESEESQTLRRRPNPAASRRMPARRICSSLSSPTIPDRRNLPSEQQEPPPQKSLELPSPAPTLAPTQSQARWNMASFIPLSPSVTPDQPRNILNSFQYSINQAKSSSTTLVISKKTPPRPVLKRRNRKEPRRESIEFVCDAGKGLQKGKDEAATGSSEGDALVCLGTASESMYVVSSILEHLLDSVVEVKDKYAMENGDFCTPASNPSQISSQKVDSLQGTLKNSSDRLHSQVAETDHSSFSVLELSQKNDEIETGNKLDDEESQACLVLLGLSSGCGSKTLDQSVSLRSADVVFTSPEVAPSEQAASAESDSNDSSSSDSSSESRSELSKPVANRKPTHKFVRSRRTSSNIKRPALSKQIISTSSSEKSDSDISDVVTSSASSSGRKRKMSQMRRKPAYRPSILKRATASRASRRNISKSFVESSDDSQSKPKPSSTVRHDRSGSSSDEITTTKKGRKRSRYFDPSSSETENESATITAPVDRCLPQIDTNRNLRFSHAILPAASPTEIEADAAAIQSQVASSNSSAMFVPVIKSHLQSERINAIESASQAYEPGEIRSEQCNREGESEISSVLAATRKPESCSEALSKRPKAVADRDSYRPAILTRKPPPIKDKFLGTEALENHDVFKKMQTTLAVDNRPKTQEPAVLKRKQSTIKDKDLGPDAHESHDRFKKMRTTLDEDNRLKTPKPEASSRRSLRPRLPVSYRETISPHRHPKGQSHLPADSDESEGGEEEGELIKKDLQDGVLRGQEEPTISSLSQPRMFVTVISATPAQSSNSLKTALPTKVGQMAEPKPVAEYVIVRNHQTPACGDVFSDVGSEAAPVSESHTGNATSPQTVVASKLRKTAPKASPPRRIIDLNAVKVDGSIVITETEKAPTKEFTIKLPLDNSYALSETPSSPTNEDQAHSKTAQKKEVRVVKRMGNKLTIVSDTLEKSTNTAGSSTTDEQSSSIKMADPETVTRKEVRVVKRMGGKLTILSDALKNISFSSAGDAPNLSEIKEKRAQVTLRLAEPETASRKVVRDVKRIIEKLTPSLSTAEEQSLPQLGVGQSEKERKEVPVVKRMGRKLRIPSDPQESSSFSLSDATSLSAIEKQSVPPLGVGKSETGPKKEAGVVKQTDSKLTEKSACHASILFPSTDEYSPEQQLLPIRKSPCKKKKVDPVSHPPVLPTVIEPFRPAILKRKQTAASHNLKQPEVLESDPLLLKQPRKEHLTAVAELPQENFETDDILKRRRFSKKLRSKAVPSSDEGNTDSSESDDENEATPAMASPPSASSSVARVLRPRAPHSYQERSPSPASSEIH